MEIKILIYLAQCSLYQGRREIIHLFLQSDVSQLMSFFLAMRHLVFGCFVLFGVTVLFIM